MPVATGRLIDGANGGIGNWAEVKAQAATCSASSSTDIDIFNVPLLRTDAYGKFIPGANGFAQFVTDRRSDRRRLVEARPDGERQPGPWCRPARSAPATRS